MISIVLSIAKLLLFILITKSLSLFIEKMRFGARGFKPSQAPATMMVDSINSYDMAVSFGERTLAPFGREHRCHLADIITKTKIEEKIGIHYLELTHFIRNFAY